MNQALFFSVIHIFIVVVVIARALLRPHREPASRVAWIVAVIAIPGLGVLAYLFLGETSIGRHNTAKMKSVLKNLPPLKVSSNRLVDQPEVSKKYKHLFDVGQSISDFPVIGGNSAKLLKDSNDAIDSMVRDIDAAKRHVHLNFYIWLSDNNGCKMIDALKRAAKRGVECRAMVDGLGSRALIKSPHWKEMQDAGVQVGIALPIKSIFLRPFAGRIDLRNHRKILVIDGHITYCGSQNCADPEFRVKPKFAPWVDLMVRFSGPIAKHNQYVFASDWMTYVDEDLNTILEEPTPDPQGDVPAEVVATGPTIRNSAMTEMFDSLIFSAREKLVITTPYYVPNKSLQAAICAAAYRGVDTTIIFPAKNDSFVVGAASRSYYSELLTAGVKIHEYVGGLLHTKSLTMDGEVALIGSANMDRRSFDLNYENNILFANTQLTEDVYRRQQQYLASSNVVSLDDVSKWSVWKRLLNNSIAMIGPVL